MYELTASIELTGPKDYWNLDHDALSNLRNFLEKTVE